MPRRGRWLFAALYDRVNAPLERRVLAPLRGQLLRNVSGRVLDLGAGTGANLSFLATAERIVAAEPDPAMRRRLRAEVDTTDLHVQVSDAAGESLPFSDGSFDWVLCTCVLCSVSDPARVLAETRRVLTPGGRLVIIEHVRGSGLLARWQDVVTPVWSLLAGGCHPNRPIAPLARQAGFSFAQLDTYDAFPTLVPTRPLIAGIGVAGSPSTLSQLPAAP